MERQLQRARSVEFVQLDTVDRFDTIRQRRGLSEEHAVESAARAAELQFQVLAADQPLVDHVERIEKPRLGKTLAPYAVTDRASEVERELARIERAVGLHLALEIGG